MIKRAMKYKKVMRNMAIEHLKYERLSLAMHLPKKTQWWSMFTTQTPHTPQWWVSGLLSTRQCLHFPIGLYCCFGLIISIFELLSVYTLCLFSIVRYFLNTSSEIPGFIIIVWMQLYNPNKSNNMFNSLNFKNDISGIPIKPDTYMKTEKKQMNITGSSENDSGNLIMAYLGIISWISYLLLFLIYLYFCFL
jgi:hypothetical protein